MSNTRPPLTNVQQVYRTAYLDLCALYVSRKDDEAEKLAWDFYQDPHIPLILRTMCCNVLGEAGGGEYLRFAKEAVECATLIFNMDTENETHIQLLKESRAILKDAVEDARKEALDSSDLLRECEQTVAEADELAAGNAVQEAALHSQAMSPSLPSASSVISSVVELTQTDTVTRSHSPPGGPKQALPMFAPLSPPLPGGEQEDEDDPQGQGE
ncbi:hypothetical protein C7974DRAFT_415240 [Boeremia exigua]|uniref:uncharacterized protein n=1 Tax=Boeremia exigua TaxID=749465 RepID=UPI001E8E0970|nr:uncharacterized protein C7974DRAFT_415240 [Boeremia exigua]KAH6619995.1 hypothetical protein C7974DRAFT_415240 [Boeremia exigua]